MAGHKSIPLQDVRNALMCAVVRLKTRTAEGERHGRTAAFTQAPFWLPTCRDRLRYGRRAMATKDGLPLGVIRYHFEPMHVGDMDEVLLRTRREHGLAEVRRTWGLGFRALRKEFSGSVVMR